jgi:hypothetical protein
VHSKFKINSADGGLRELSVDSGVYAGNTAELMLVGKEFSKDVRGFTTRQTVKTTKSKNMAIQITYNSITKFAS